MAQRSKTKTRRTKRKPVRTTAPASKPSAVARGEGKITFHKPPAVVIEVFQDKAGQFRFHAKAKNGEIIASGEGYTRKWSAARGAQRTFPGAELRFLNTAPAQP